MQRTIINPLYKDTITFLETAAESNGKHTFLEATLLPGGSNPPHYHTAFTETFIAVQSVLGLQLQGKKIRLQPGERYTVQKREVHNFFNPGSEEITFRIIFEPGHIGMEQTLRIAYGLAADGLTNKKGMPKSLFAAALIMELSNSYPAGIMSLVRPMLSLLARRAEKRGLKKILIEQYCSPFDVTSERKKEGLQKETV